MLLFWMAHCATTMQTMASGKCWLDVSLSARGLSAPIPPHVMAPILAVKPNVKSLCVSNFVRGIGSTIDVGRNLRLMPVLCSVKVRGGFCWVIGELFMLGCGKI